MTLSKREQIERLTKACVRIAARAFNTNNPTSNEPGRNEAIGRVAATLLNEAFRDHEVLTALLEE